MTVRHWCRARRGEETRYQGAGGASQHWQSHANLCAPSVSPRFLTCVEPWIGARSRKAGCAAACGGERARASDARQHIGGQCGDFTATRLTPRETVGTGRPPHVEQAVVPGSSVVAPLGRGRERRPPCRVRRHQASLGLGQEAGRHGAENSKLSCRYSTETYVWGSTRGGGRERVSSVRVGDGSRKRRLWMPALRKRRQVRQLSGLHRTSAAASRWTTAGWHAAE